VLDHSFKLSVINRRTKLKRGDGGRFVMTLVKPSNYLMFVTSRFGFPVWPGIPLEARSQGWISMYQPEKDYFYPDKTMMSLGRDSLFRILNPDAQIRMVIEYTASLNADRQNLVPAVSVIGDRRYMLDVEGRGSARLFSPVIRAQEIEGGQYI